MGGFVGEMPKTLADAPVRHGIAPVRDWCDGGFVGEMPKTLVDAPARHGFTPL